MEVSERLAGAAVFHEAIRNTDLGEIGSISSYNELTRAALDVADREDDLRWVDVVKRNRQMSALLDFERV